MTVLLIKFVTCLIAYAVALDLFFDATWVDIIWFSLATTAITYLAGDRLLLARFGNRNALIADFFLSYLLVWIFGSVLLTNYLQIGWGSIIAASIITVGEYFVHLLLSRKIRETDSNQVNATGKLAYSMEMSEETDPTYHLKKGSE